MARKKLMTLEEKAELLSDYMYIDETTKNVYMIDPDNKDHQLLNEDNMQVLFYKITGKGLHNNDVSSLFNFLNVCKWQLMPEQSRFKLIPDLLYDENTVQYIKSKRYWKQWLAILKYMLMSKDNNKKIFFVIHGPTNTGKTTYIMNTMAKLIDDWKGMSENLQWLDNGFMAQVCWKDELTNADYIDAHVINSIKTLTGNAGKIAINQKYGRIKQIPTKCKLLLTFNEPSKMSQNEAPYFFSRMFYIYDDSNVHEKTNFNPKIDINTLYSMVIRSDDSWLIEDEISLSHKKEWQEHCDSVLQYKKQTSSSIFSFLDYANWCHKNHYKPIAETEAKKRWKIIE